MTINSAQKTPKRIPYEFYLREVSRTQDGYAVSIRRATNNQIITSFNY